MEKLTKEQEILKILFKDLNENYNSRNMSQLVGLSHAGSFKILENLKRKGIVNSKKIGKANIYSINFEDRIAERQIEIILTLEARAHKKWLEEFSALEEKVNFVILFGSIIKNEKEAKDIDLLIVSEKNNFNKIKLELEKKKNILTKPLHALHETSEDFIKDLNSRNKTMLEILKTGIVLYGQEALIKIRKLIR